jgi:NADH:ubiquinone oxidoreductase subunit E
MGDHEKLDAIIACYSGDSAYILAMFQDVQRGLRYLPKEAVEYICERLHVPVSKGYEVSTFYKTISLTPRGKHTIHVCLGTACHLRGGPNILDGFERELKIQKGSTTEDGFFTLESVNCLGACALAPIVRVDETDFGKATQTTVREIVKTFGSGEEA